MPAMTIKTRLTLAFLVAFAVVGTIVTVFVQASFHDTEARHAQADARARIEAMTSLVEARLGQLGREAQIAADDVGATDTATIMDNLRRVGFLGVLVLDANGTGTAADGMAGTNQSLRTMLTDLTPARATRYAFEDGWFIVAARSTNLQHAVVGALPGPYLSDVFLADLLRHPEYGHAIVLEDGRIVAYSKHYSMDAREAGALAGPHEGAHVHREHLVILDGYIESVVPHEVIDARVAAMTARFILAMIVAFGVGGSVTIVAVTLAFRPLDRITDAARRLGRGEEDLHLPVRSRDEMGTLSEALNNAAKAIGTARRAEAERAAQARIAAEEFELAIGELSRSVGEADTPAEVAARLAEGLLRVTSAQAAIVRSAGETVAIAERGEGGPAATAIEALFQSNPEAFHLSQARGGNGDLIVGLLPADGGSLADAETRKADILTAQGTIGIHRARASMELRRAKAHTETFLDILSHDLKNPIAIARGRVDQIGVKFPELRERADQIDRSLERASKIISEAVFLSKVDRTEALDRSPLNMTTLVEEVAASLRPLAQTRGITIEVEAPPSLPWRANPLLQRAVDNLVSNAIKWSPEESIVKLRLESDGDCCRIAVVDHGPGIPDDDKPRVFARFERADRTGVGGTGLGLAIARRVVEIHGGEIRIADTPGGGCTFQIILPNAAQEVPAAPTGGNS